MILTFIAYLEYRARYWRDVWRSAMRAEREKRV